MEARVVDAIINMVGSDETDEMIKDIVQQSMAKARAEIGERSWKTMVGLRKADPAARL